MDRGEIKCDEVSGRGVCKELMRYAWMILLAAATVWLGAAGIGRLSYVPQYTASATLVVSTKGGTGVYSSLAMSSQMANVFSDVFQSEALRKYIAEDIGEEVNGVITCEQIQETNLLVLQVVAETPREAYLFLHSALEHYKEVSGYVFANAGLEIVQEPSVPEEPSNQSLLWELRNIVAVLGAVLMAGVIFIFYLLRYTVKNSASAARQLDGSVRGVIPYEKRRVRKGRKKKREAPLLNSPLVSMKYAEASRRAEAGVEYHMRKRRQKVLLVTSVSENEGKSTVAANLAIALAEKHRKVLLIDGDFRKPAQYKIFGRKKSKIPSLRKVLLGKASWKEAIVRNKKSGVWELFLYRPLSNLSEILNSDRLDELLKNCRKEMDYIIIDSSPTSVATDAEVWMQLADTVLLVVRQDWSDVRIINDTVDLIWQSSGDFAGFVLNAFHEEHSRSCQKYGYGEYGMG